MFERVNRTGHRRRRARRGTVALAAIGVLVLLALALAWVDPSALRALPALALPLLLAIRRYPGERILVILRQTRRRRRRRPCSVRPDGARSEFVLARGGLLLARSLAVRPPPPAAPTVA